MSARFHAKDGELVVLYECDPSKNTKCRKTNCKERGGPCSETTEPEMRVDGAKPHYYTAESRGGKTVFITAKFLKIFDLPLSVLRMDHPFIRCRVERYEAAALFLKRFAEAMLWKVWRTS